MPTAKLARNGGAVRLTLSAKAASDIGALERSLKSLAERLGHPNCATGCDTLFLELERDFVVNEELQLNAAPRALGQELSLPQDPVPTRAVRVMIPEKVNNNIKSLQKALATTLGKLGCQACCSGFDILFQRELDLIAFDDRVNARGFGRFR
jgi:hypothetical protein